MKESNSTNSVYINPLSLALLKVSSEKTNNPSADNGNNHNISSAKYRHDRKKSNNGTADPIRDDNDIALAKEWLLNKPDRYNDNIRDYLLFVIGCNTARRIGDIIKFTFGTFMYDIGKFKDYFEIKEQKTGKSIKLIINQNIQDAIAEYIRIKYPNNDYTLNTHLFLSRTQTVNGIYDGNRHITRTQAWRMYNSMGEAIGLKDKGLRISCHTPRKTWVYKALTTNKNDPYVLTTVSEMLNHSSTKITMAYAGITQEDRDKIMLQGI